MKNKIRTYRYILIGLLIISTVILSEFVTQNISEKEQANAVEQYYEEHPFEQESVEEISSEPESQEESSVSESNLTESSVPKSESKSSVTSKASKAEEKKPVPVPQENNIIKLIDYTKAATYKTIDSQINTLCKAYPDLITRGSIGKSVRGRKIFLVTVGKGTKKALIVGGIHAREHITVSFIMRCIEDYAAAYYSEDGRMDGYNIKKLLDEYTLYIVPNTNPDGTEIVLSGEYPATSVTVTKRSMYKANANGVNLNRNFPFQWENIIPETDAPDEKKYIGSSAGSEPETQALMKLCKENDFEWMTSMHLQGDCIYWSDEVNINVGGYADGVVTPICKKFDFYKCPTSTDLSLYGGGFENWFRAEYNKIGLCIELVPLDYNVSPTTNKDNLRFEASLRYSKTRGVFAAMMSLV